MVRLCPDCRRVLRVWFHKAGHWIHPTWLAGMCRIGIYHAAPTATGWEHPADLPTVECRHGVYV